MLIRRYLKNQYQGIIERENVFPVPALASIRRIPFDKGYLLG